MKLRLLATLCCLAISGSLLQGCAGNPSREPESAAAERVDISRLPQLDVPGANSADLRSLAMGLARSKGWELARSPKDQMIARRPLEADALAALAPDSDPRQTSDATLEVTSYFVDQSFGTLVATRATLVSPGPQGKGPRRLDCTEQYQGILMDSLASLRDAWPRARNKIAHATPPAEGWKDAWADNKPAVADSATPAGAAGAATVPRPEPVRSAVAQDPPVVREEASDSVPTGVAPVPMPRVTQVQPVTSRPAPEPRRAAPVVDASQGTRTTVKPAASQQTRPQPSANMMQLPASASSRQTAVAGRTAATAVAMAPARPATPVKTTTTKAAAPTATTTPAKTATPSKTSTAAKTKNTPPKPQTPAATTATKTTSTPAKPKTAATPAATTKATAQKPKTQSAAKATPAKAAAPSKTGAATDTATRKPQAATTTKTAAKPQSKTTSTKPKDQ